MKVAVHAVETGVFVTGGFVTGGSVVADPASELEPWDIRKAAAPPAKATPPKVHHSQLLEDFTS